MNLQKYRQYVDNITLAINKQINRQEKLMCNASGQEVLELMGTIKDIVGIMNTLITETEEAFKDKK